MRVRFSAARPGVAYVGERSSEGNGLVADILSKPMPPLHKEDNFRMDAHTAASIGDVSVIQVGNCAGILDFSTLPHLPCLYCRCLQVSGAASEQEV